jgi:SAM-dependent methyltransferase
MKSTVEEIRQRFDGDVERFSNLETGQSATVDAPLAMALVAKAAALCTPQARSVLDVGCGAGNYTLKLLELLPNLDVTRPSDSARRVRAPSGAFRATCVTPFLGTASSTSFWPRPFCIICERIGNGSTFTHLFTGR